MEAATNTNGEATITYRCPGLLHLPTGVLQLVLSFLPATVTVRSVASIAPRLALITQSNIYWKCMWRAYLDMCACQYVGRRPRTLREGAQQGSNRLFHGTHGSPLTLLLSVKKCVLANTRVVNKFNNKMVLLEEPSPGANSSRAGESEGNDEHVIHVLYAVDPLFPVTSAPSLPAVGSHHAPVTPAALRDKESNDEICGSEEDIAINGRKTYLDASEYNTLLLRKALCFLHSNNTCELFFRPMVDGLHVVRPFFSPHKQGALEESGGMAVKQEAVLVEFINAVAYSLECCTSCRTTEPAVTAGLSKLFLETKAEPVFMIGNDVATVLENATAMVAAGTASGGSHDGVFFSIFEPPTVVGPKVASKLRCSDFSTQVYLFLLQHVSFSDIHVYIGDDERKCATCSRVVSPTGRAVEFRFFYSLFLDGYPRFYAKMVFVEGDLPRTRMLDVYDQRDGRNTKSSSGGASSDEEEPPPQPHMLFFGGYGRVEVDIAPTISQEGFQLLHRALGLTAAILPTPLLWNVVMLASGVGGVVLREQQWCFSSYYGTSFAGAFEQKLGSSG